MNSFHLIKSKSVVNSPTIIDEEPKILVMKFLTIVVITILMSSVSLHAQVDKSVHKKAQNIALKLDKVTGKIELFNIKKNVEITEDYELGFLELDIYDAHGDYVGSLELKGLLIPENEVDKSENVKISKFRFKNTETGELFILTNVDFIK